MKNNARTVNVGQNHAGCLTCGAVFDDQIFPLHQFYTPTNNEGPFCCCCIEEASDIEREDNSQFGVGA